LEVLVDSDSAGQQLDKAIRREIHRRGRADAIEQVVDVVERLLDSHHDYFDRRYVEELVAQELALDKGRRYLEMGRYQELRRWLQDAG
jgi:hypothetical protein